MPHFQNKNTFYSKPFRVVLPSPDAAKYVHSTSRVLRSSRGGLGRTNLAGLHFEHTPS
eukprot:CAMPEP_0114111010 /NCGR_PEP_ID=MMETSP0043_2-20121206/1619_1 /TAXON_ID=464988 /ORGANISM="Hemiselmis andersenii, Strain CCMP644" /LENGTH=57 /DNA_ID=CAMNT_0001203001 /DNA_START=171 /DNA_END=341 /DNA_ORIENTATION=+